MKFIPLIILLAILFGCATKNKTDEQVKFTTIVTSILSDTSISRTVFFKEHFICMKDDNTFGSYSMDLKNDSLFNSFLNKQKINYAYVANDTLFGEINDDRYFFSSQNIWTKTKLNTREFSNPLFEDSNYIVDACCVGEFGGAIFFRDKQTKRVYSCPATCATIVNKINNEYYVTNSLAHMDGSTEILRIKDPTKLYELTVDSLKHWCNWWTNFVTYEDHFAGMKKFMIGTDTLIDSIGVMTLTSFVYKDKLYNINCNLKKTYLTAIENKRLVTLDSIFDAPLWSYEPENKVFKNFYLHSFHNHHNSGFIIIKSDTVNIVTFNTKKK